MPHSSGVRNQQGLIMEFNHWRDGLAEISFQLLALVRELAHCYVEETKTVPALRFSSIECKVSLLQQLIWIDTVIRRAGIPMLTPI
jgi:hypothetical protein